MHSDLNPASVSPCRTTPARLTRSLPSLARQARRGFALIVTLSLMTLLLLLVLTLTTLVRINMDTASANLVTAQARQNALLAAYIGIGQLQKFAGSDQRVTTTAYLERGGKTPDADDSTAEMNPQADQIFGPQDSTGSGSSISNGQSANSDTPLAPINPAGGDWYWTAVWGPGANPLSLYTGLGQDMNGNTKNAPDPILLNWLVSGDEGTPLTANFTKNGQVMPPPGANGAVTYTPSQSANISSNSQPLPNNWTALTNDITITPTIPPTGVKGDQPAALLVGPNTAFTGSTDSYTIFMADNSTTVIKEPRSVNIIVAPIVTINETTPIGAANFTAGRYAFWVGDEGVKAKYTPVDPYLGNISVATTGDGGQLSRYRFWAPLRSGIERMLGMATYGNINPATGATNISSNSPTSKLKQLLEPSQIYFVDANLTGVGSTGTSHDANHPEQTLQTNYFDFTTYSYGVIADTLRGGLRYDLTTAFHETTSGRQTTAFKDTTNGLLNRAILPGDITTAAASITTTTEPNVVAGGPKGVKILAPEGPAPTGTITFHGPDCPPTPDVTNPNIGGLRWDAIENFYNISFNNNSGTAVKVQPGSTVKAGITPLITQFRLRFGQFADNISEQYVSVEPEFVLANPYSFPITGAGGGMDLGFRINTSTVPPGYGTGWEWFAGLEARNDIRMAPSASGEGIPLGYDTTQTIGLNGKASNAMGYGYQFLSTSLGSGTPVPGYYPFLKDTVDYGAAALNTPQGNGGYNSVLDNIAFHITQANTTFAPGEAKVFSLTPGTIAKSVVGGYNRPEGNVTAWVGSPLSGNGSGSSSIKSSQIAIVSLSAIQPAYGTNSPNLPAPYYFLRDTGVNTASGKYINLNTTVNIDPVNPTPPWTSGNGLWPGEEFGYISTMQPGVAFTLELRSDLTEPTPPATGVATNPQNYQFNSGTPTISTGVAGPGQNVLQSLTNMDLTGAGVMAGVTAQGVQPNPKGYVPPFALGTGFRRQYLGTFPMGSSLAGSMPVFLSTYFNMLSLPGNLGDGQTQNGSNTEHDMLGFYVNYKDNGDSGTFPEGWFDATQVASYRVYTDHNLRAVNMALPPFASFNSPWANKATTPTYGPSGSVNNTNSFMTVPPYGRIFDEGPGPDDTVITGNEDVTFSQNSLGKNGTNGIGFTSGNGSDDAAWGYSNSKTGGGEQYVTLYSLPTKGTSPTETINSTVNVPDVPMMSLGQLTHADFTEDDIWCSVGYQPGNAFGNSYFSPYVTRGSSIQSHQNLSATKVLLTEQGGPSGGPGQMLGFTKNNNTSPLPTTVYAYDISYIMNVALWDRYFFSTLVPSLSQYPANSRLAFTAGYSSATVQSIMQGGTTTLDPATGQTTFVAYAPARFLMIDGAFNINSTSFEAWRAVLSALRGVAFSNGTGTGTGSASGTVSYYPRTMPSNQLKSLSSSSVSVNTPINDNNLSPGSSSTQSGLNDPPSYAGFRQLTDQEIDMLAAKIVQQVHQRGPFLSLAQFVNRNLQYSYTGGSSADPHLIYSISGPLQAAIDMSTGTNYPSLNGFFGKPAADAGGLFIPGGPYNSGNGTYNGANSNSNAIYPDAGLLNGGGNPYTALNFSQPSNSANPYSVLTGIPGWLTQADLLETLAPILSARSDTFTIRSYGEVLNPSVNQANLYLPPSDTRNPITNDLSAVQGRAWCEVVVQRMPDYLNDDANHANLNDPSCTTGYNAPNPSANSNAPNLTPVNAYFGRRFKIVSIKWLTADDI